MNYIVLDLEWNQSPTGKESSVDGLPFEIIEIGAVRLNENMEQTGEFHRLISPVVYRELHYKSHQVTHLDMKKLQREGEEFPVVFQEFLDWCGTEEYRFCTWGSMDLTELQRNVRFYGLENPFEKPLLYYDVQKLYSLEYGDGKTRSALEQAAEELGLDLQRPFHRALDDAWYTGRVMAALDIKQYGVFVSVDYYRLPETGKGYRLYFPTYSKYVSPEFTQREDLLKNKQVTDVICPKCHRMLKKKIRWFPYGQRYYLCLAVCPEHGLVRSKIRVKKSEDGFYYAVRTTKEASEEDGENVARRKEDMKQKRKNPPKR